MERPQEDEHDRRICRLKENFKQALSPMEPTIMKLQSLLVWERPAKSAVLLVGVHCLFWFLNFSSCYFYTIICTAIMIVYMLHTWKKKIWPEIRVPPKELETDDWTPVHPKLLSVPELCEHLASCYCYLNQCCQYWMGLRRNRPFKFCIEACFIFACTAIIGHYISGVMLSYIIIMSIVLWPCLQYHNLLKKIYMKCEPLFMKLDYSMKVKNKWRYEGDRAEVSLNETCDDGKLSTSECADNESDLEDFYPSDPLLSAKLAHAITDSEDETGSPTVSLTPNVSKEPSVTNTDDEILDEEAIEDEFALSVNTMPSFEETLDHTDDEFLEPEMPVVRQRSSSREGSEEVMHFMPKHFDDSDLEPDFEDDDEPVEPVVRPKTKTRARAQGSRNWNADPSQKDDGADNFMTKALTSAVSAAIQSSVIGALHNFASASNPNLARSSASAKERTASARSDNLTRSSVSDRVASAGSDSDSDLGDYDDSDTLDHGIAEDLKGRKVSEDSASLNIEEDFEFLDEYDLDSSQESPRQ